MELIATLGIDWQVMVAQLVNFILLIGVLSFFVYRPVLRLLDDRRERIRKSMEDAKQIENQKRDFDQHRTAKLRTVDAESGKMLENAKQLAEGMKKEILAGAEKEAAQILAKAKQQADDDRARLMQEAQESVATMVLKMTEKVLEREFSAADQTRIIGSMKKDLPALIR